MFSWIYDYVDGTLKDVKHGTIGVKVCKHDERICIWKKGSDYFSVDIPKKNIVEIDYFTRDTTVKKSKLLYAVAGVAIAGGLSAMGLAPLILGQKLVAMGAGAVDLMASSGVVGAGAGFGSKSKQENYFMISYIDEKEPGELKVVILEHKKIMLNDAIKFFDELMEDDKAIKKSRFVYAYLQNVKDIAEGKEDTEKNLDFFMKVSTVDNIFKIQGNGTTVTGKVAFGKISCGDDVWLCSPNYGKVLKTKAISIIKSKDKAEYAEAGENASILLEGLNPSQVNQDDILTTDIIDLTDSSPDGRCVTSFYADVKVFDESGLEDPLCDRVTYSFDFGSHVINGTMQFPKDRDSILFHGIEDVVIVELEKPVNICKGIEFSIANDNTLNAKGVISDFCDE